MQRHGIKTTQDKRRGEGRGGGGRGVNSTAQLKGNIQKKDTGENDVLRIMQQGRYRKKSISL